MDALMFGQQFGEMPEVGLIIFRTIKVCHRIAGFIRDGGRRLASFVAMNKEGFPLFEVPLTMRLICRLVQPRESQARSLREFGWSASALITSYFLCSSIERFTFLMMISSYHLTS